MTLSGENYHMFQNLNVISKNFLNSKHVFNVDPVKTVYFAILESERNNYLSLLLIFIGENLDIYLLNKLQRTNSTRYLNICFGKMS